MPGKILYRSDMISCVLCLDAPCSAACDKMDPAGFLRSIWFENDKTAAASAPAQNPCADCAAPCEEACVRPHKVPVRELMTRLCDEVRPALEVPMPQTESRLRTEICGIPLENPFLLSSSVVSSTYDMCARAFEAGWAGAVFKTICSLDIHEASPRFSAVTGADGSIIGFKNVEQLSDHSVEENMETFRRLKKDYPSKVIIASIMGDDEADWERLARLCDENGADVIELNFSCPNMAEGGLGSDIGQVPELVEHFTACARRGTKKPVFAKLTPNVASLNPAAEAAIRGGADGIAAINTIKSIVGVNPLTYISSPAVHGMSAVGGYSGSAVRPIALRLIEEMGHNPALKGVQISGMGGIETWRDALEYIMMGAGTVQVTTAVMQYGYRIIDDLKSGLNMYLAEVGLDHVRDLTGVALDYVSDTTDVLERDTVVYPKFKRGRCNGCGRCVISCRDGGHQAIRLTAERRPQMDARKCVGCHLCVLVCPQRAIVSSGKRVSKAVPGPGPDSTGKKEKELERKERQMSIVKARRYLEEKGYSDRIIETDVSTATVELAAEAIGVEPGRICKSLSFLLEERPILILAEGMARIDNRKYKDTFGKKAKMIPRDQVEEYIGYEAGGVCPFGVNPNVEIYLDESLRKWDEVYPAVGNANSAVRLSLEELEEVVDVLGWVDVCK